MADDFLSFMAFIFKALFLKTLKFQLCRYFSLRPHDESSWDKKKSVFPMKKILTHKNLKMATLRPITT